MLGETLLGETLVHLKLGETFLVKRNWANCYHTKKADIQSINDEIANLNWNELFVNFDTQNCWDTFKSKLDEIIAKNVPFRNVKKRFQTIMDAKKCDEISS